ncbi:MAG: hypothetical protein ACHQ0J_02890 [Candidatus Dormibacterales bacterium]
MVQVFPALIALAGVAGTLVVLSGSAVYARRWFGLRPADPTFPIAPVPHRVQVWRAAGVAAGLAAAYLATSVNIGFGIGPLMSMPAFGACVLLGVLGGELTAPGPGRTPVRTAPLENRSLTRYLPRRMVLLLASLTGLLATVLLITSLAGAPDDQGRAGRWISVTCLDGTTSMLGPWPGLYYSFPTALVVLTGGFIAWLTVHRVARRPRASLDADVRAKDEAIRQRTGFAVTAAAGILVAGPLTGIGLISGLDLLGSCGSVTVQVAGLSLVAVGFEALIALGFFMLVVLFPRLSEAPPGGHEQG